MTLQEVAEELRQLARSHVMPELLHLANEIRRRRFGPRAKATSQPMTPELEDAIRAYAKAHPGLPQKRIADAFNVNPGRVSEALRGKRT